MDITQWSELDDDLDSTGVNGTIIDDGKRVSSSGDDRPYPSMTDAEADQYQQDKDREEFLANPPRMPPGEQLVTVLYRRKAG